jgi:hypothetical protein
MSDNGCGIPDEHRPRIFTPFFTTKGVRDGTGLGLSITHGIVQDHGGRLNVESVAGQGTCFRLILPVTRAWPASGNAIRDGMPSPSRIFWINNSRHTASHHNQGGGSTGN